MRQNYQSFCKEVAPNSDQVTSGKERLNWANVYFLARIEYFLIFDTREMCERIFISTIKIVYLIH